MLRLANTEVAVLTRVMLCLQKGSCRVAFCSRNTWQQLSQRQKSFPNLGSKLMPICLSVMKWWLQRPAPPLLSLPLVWFVFMTCKQSLKPTARAAFVQVPTGHHVFIR